MKKTLLLGLAISLALGVTACSSGDNTDVDKNKDEQKQEIGSKKEEEKQYIYGKVKSIVGNEIEFDLAKDPGKDIEALDPEDETVDDKKEMPAVMTTPAMEGNPEDMKVSVGDIEENNPLVELEFTGKEKTIIIPTGITINILTQRSGEGIGAIKDGTYLKLEVDNNKSENPTVLSVDVIS